MSTPTPDKPEEAQATEPKDKLPGKQEKAEDASRKGLNYVFKIAPADPKNAFDFEDIADK